MTPPTDVTSTAAPTEVPRMASRRIVFRGALSGCALAMLAACGSDGDGAEAGGASDAESGDAASSSPSATESASESGSSGGGGAAALVATAEVPVGGGVILPDQRVVVTQPAKGTFQGFSAACTHQGFTVGSVKDGVITCNHHGSRFSAEDGSVENGPASKALPAVKLRVEGDQIFLA